MAEPSLKDSVARISRDTISALTAVGSAARAQLAERSTSGADAFANINTFTSGGAVKSLGDIDEARARSLVSLAREPAIARIVVELEDGETATYYICRNTAESFGNAAFRLAGRNTPAGRLASLNVGDDFELQLPKGEVTVTVLEKGILHPQFTDTFWDSQNSVLYTESYGPITVPSMQKLLIEPSQASLTEEDLLAHILAEAQQTDDIIEGIRRTVITKMGLRDQPILDRYQDEIFRLPLQKQLLIIGPPGTGKTTTLIRRLGQKLDQAYFEDDERRLASSAEAESGMPHKDSWLMFTPTDLLKQYLKEAFAREGIAAPDQKISTWDRYRLELARNHFRILKSSAGGGAYVQQRDAKILLPETITGQTDWFLDFNEWQLAEFWSELAAAAETLKKSKRADVARIGNEAEALLGRLRRLTTASALLELVRFIGSVQEPLSSLRAESDERIRRHINFRLNHDRGLLTDFARFLDTLTPEEDLEEGDGEDDEDVTPAQTPVAKALAAFTSNIRSQAIAAASGRTAPRGGRAARIATWIGDRTMERTELRQLGDSLQLQAALRRFTNPIRRYVNGLPARYRRFRRARITEARWYDTAVMSAADAHPLEVDLMLAGTLDVLAEIVTEPALGRLPDSGALEPVRQYRTLVRNQIMVDEATDFSPLQLCSMAALSNPTIRSFFACGDFNQRITQWGSRSNEDMSWAVPGIDVRPIEVTYRHSRQLSHLASEIVRLCSGQTVHVTLPKDIKSDGVDPVLATNLVGHDAIADWLAERLVEVEGLTSPLPSVAVLVNSEREVGPLTEALRKRVEAHNMNVVPCYEGQFAGQNNDIRVFDVQHIKGLEFEAVFFVGVDDLAEQYPDLFDKYLYVGTTRAATYLGLTCHGATLPEKIEKTMPLFKKAFAF
ncbi:ATP-binding domain-containing protein [Paenirhodobacter populi]|uniref:DNA 3'-5' helicase II n=1 Tax=Paenirhodobacter populi TaxID=2306993 RepID=A0A443JRD6_9RHOB|nr:ATP-binding domain-containing protein [Sinirhodobacter populi]RWR23032.1 DNA helicase UvrD [Sinirhodobacter populi]